VPAGLIDVTRDLAERGFPLPAIDVRVAELSGVLHAETCYQVYSAAAGVTDAPLLGLLERSWCNDCLTRLEGSLDSSTQFRLRDWVQGCQLLAQSHDEAAAAARLTGVTFEEALEVVASLSDPLVADPLLPAAGGLRDWAEAVGQFRSAVLVAFIERHRAIIEPGLLRLLAEQVTLLPSHLSTPDVTEVTAPLRAQAAALAQELLRSSQRALVDVAPPHQGQTPSSFLVRSYYGVAPGVLLAPLVVLLFLRSDTRFSWVNDAVLLDADVTASDVEAAVVLYDPDSYGPLSTLARALEAACAL
jgi:hypothetical protein